MWEKKCFFRGCNSNSGDVNKGLLKGVSFIGLPKPEADLNRHRKWLHLCDLSPRDGVLVDVTDICICSLHFVGHKGPTADHPDPIMATKGIEDTDTSSDEEKDAFLNVINDSARVMLEHSYASLYGKDKTGADTYRGSCNIEKPFRGFINIPKFQLTNVSKGTVISEDEVARMCSIGRKTKRTQPVQSNPSANKKRNKRRKSIMFKKKSTTSKQFQRKVSSNKRQEPFTFVEVQQAKMNKGKNCLRYSSAEVTSFDENVKIKEEMLDGTDSDTISLPSPPVFIDSSSEGETESFKDSFSQSEFSRTTIVNEYNLPDIPLSDPLSLTEGDFDMKDSVLNSSEHASSCYVSPISFSAAPKEELEDKLVLCPDLFDGGATHSGLPVPAKTPAAGCWRAPELIAGDVAVKKEMDNDASVAVESEHSHHSSPLPAEIVPVASGNVRGLSNCTHNHRTADQHSMVSDDPGFGSENMTMPTSGDVVCNRADNSSFQQTLLNHSQDKHVQTNESTLLCSASNSKAVVHRVGSSIKRSAGWPAENYCDNLAFDSSSKDCESISGETALNVSESMTDSVATSCRSMHMPSESKNCVSHHVQEKIKLPPERLSFPPEKTTTFPQYVRNTILGPSVIMSSSQGGCNIPHTVQRQWFVITSKKLPISTRPVPPLAKIAETEIHSDPILPGRVSNVAVSVPKNLFLASSETLQTPGEVTQSFVHSDKEDSPKNVQSRNVKNMAKKDIKTSPKLVCIAPKENTHIISPSNPKIVRSSCNDESVLSKSTTYCSSSSDERNFDQALPQKTTVPVRGKKNTVLNNQQPTKFVCKKLKSSECQEEQDAFGDKGVSSSSECVDEVFVERTWSSGALVASEETVVHADRPAPNDDMRSQSVVGSSCVDLSCGNSVNSSYAHLGRYDKLNATSNYSNLMTSRNNYLSAVDKLNKRMRFLSRLKNIMGSKNVRNYKS